MKTETKIHVGKIQLSSVVVTVTTHITVDDDVTGYVAIEVGNQNVRLVLTSNEPEQLSDLIDKAYEVLKGYLNA